MKKPARIYRAILGEAIRLTRERKTLWVFGLFAGLISTGGVIDVAMRSFHRIDTSATLLGNLAQRSFFGYVVFGQYIRELALIDDTRVVIMFVLITLVLIGLIIAGVIGQIALILGSKSTHGRTPRDLRKETFPHVISVLVIDILAKLVTGIMIVLTSLPILLFNLAGTQANFWIMFAHTVVFLAMIIVINILSILSIIDIVDRGSSPLFAIASAWRVFTRHGIATIEFALLLFLLVSIAGIFVIILAGLLMIPYAIIYTATLLSGSTWIFILSNTLFGILSVAVILTFAGAVVCFHYVAWHRFYKRALHRTHGKQVFSKILRLMTIVTKS